MRILIASLLLAGLLTVNAGCTTKQAPTQEPNITNPGTSVKNGAPLLQEVILYFVNKEYVQTGNENLKKVLPEKRRINIANTTKAEAIVSELMKGPISSNLTSEIPAKAKVNSVKVSDDTVFVDFSKENMTGSSLEEDLMIAQFVDSLLGVDNIKKVQFLIDGKKAETLMGHFDISEPYTERQ